MPSSVSINGATIYKPGVYGQVDASGLPALPVAIGNVAVVGSFPFLKNDTPAKVYSAAALRALDPLNADLARLAKLLFAPCSDSRVGGAASVTLVNVQTVGQATKDLMQANPAVVSLTAKAKTWGLRGNQAWLSIAAAAADATNGFDILVKQQGFQDESFKNVQSGALVQLTLNTGVGANQNSDLDGANDGSRVTVLPSQWTWQWNKRLTSNGNPVAVTELLVKSGTKLSYVLTGAVATATNLTVVGKDATGVAQTAIHAIPNGQANGTYDVTNNNAAVTWSAVESITLAAGQNATVDLEGTAFDILTAGFSKVSDVCTFINNFNSIGFFANIKLPKAYQVPATDVDEMGSLSVKNAAANAGLLRATLWAIVQELSASQIVAVSKGASATKPPSVMFAGFLFGGSESSVTVSTDYPDALSKIANQDIQSVAVLSNDVEAGKALVVHCTDAAVNFGTERNGWFGCPGGSALATIASDYVAKINSRNVSLCADKIRIAATQVGGSPEWLDPQWAAVACMGAQAGTPVATPLTNKVFDYLDISHSWLDGSDENAVIAANVCAFYKDVQGRILCLRSVTTNNDNSIFSEMSSVESVNTSIRDLRAGLKVLIGEAITASLSPSVIAGLARSRLDKQVAAGIIKAYKDVAVVLQGDKYSVNYSVAVVQPLNFITVTAHLGEF